MFGLFALIGLMGLAAQGAGAVISYTNAQKANEEARKQHQIELAMEKAKENQMELEAKRQRREIVRRTVAAQAQSEAIATNQGAGYGSGLQGAIAQASNQGAFALQGINSAEAMGHETARANSFISESRLRQSEDISGIQMGQGLSSLGNSLTNNAGTYTKLIGLF